MRALWDRNVTEQCSLSGMRVYEPVDSSSNVKHVYIDTLGLVHSQVTRLPIFPVVSLNEAGWPMLGSLSRESWSALKVNLKNDQSIRHKFSSTFVPVERWNS